jgi:hypothetical protein
VYVTGFTGSPNFPVTPFGFAVTPLGGADGVVTKFPLGSPFGLSILGITPSVGGNTGPVTATVTGTGFHFGSVLKLLCAGDVEVSASNVVIGVGGRTITGTFLLSGVSPGSCSVSVTEPDGSAVSDAGGFAVEQGGSPNMWVDVVGLSLMRAGSEQDYFIVYGNSGTVDASDIAIQYQVSPVMTVVIRPGQAPLMSDVDPDTGNTEVVFAVPNVGAKQSGALVIRVAAPPLGTDEEIPFEIGAMVTWSSPSHN